MKKFILPTFVPFFLLCIVATSVKATEQIIKVATGVSALENFLTQIKEPFQKKYSVKLEYLEAAGHQSVVDVLEGKADVAFTIGSLDYAKERIASIKPEFKDFKGVASEIMGNDNVKVIANIDCGLSELTDEQVKKITSGEVNNWKDVGGADLPIRFVRAQNSLGNWWQRDILKGKTLRKPDVQGGKISEIATILAKTKGSFAFAPKKFKETVQVKIMKTPIYGRPIYAYTKGSPSPQVRLLYDFIKGEGKSYY